MSVTNPERVATKQDLKDFYDIIFPYLGGNAEAGFTPIGTIIAVMGNSAPTNYLACNGQVVNIADYPELANYFLAQFGSRNKFGGNGTTTFGIPDLRGEFLRGTGTNGHANQGKGAAVGTHQDATQVPPLAIESNTFAFCDKNSYSAWHWTEANTDSSITQATVYVTQATAKSQFTQTNGTVAVTSRPTNTAVLYCIATKNIYLNPSLNMTTEEQVVGTFIDGKPIYQKTINCGALPNATTKDVDTGLTDVDNVVMISGTSYEVNDSSFDVIPLPHVSHGATTYNVEMYYWKNKIRIITSFNYSAYTKTFVTVRYTKTSD